jgi:hypothetical protein
MLSPIDVKIATVAAEEPKATVEKDKSTANVHKHLCLLTGWHQNSGAGQTVLLLAKERL